MSRQTWLQLLAVKTADGSAIANTVTETVIFTGYTFPANGVNVEDVLRLVLVGKYSNTGTPTLRLRVRYGGVSGTLIADTGAITTPSGVTNQALRVQVEIIIRAVGASGSMLATLVAHGLGSATAVNLGTAGGATAPAAVSVDTTSAKELCITAEWGTASSSNTLLGMGQHLESMN